MMSNIDLRFEHIKTFSFLHGQLPTNMVDEFNGYSNGNSTINLEDDIPKGLCNLFKSSGRSFVSMYSEQLPLGGGSSFENVDIKCKSMKVVDKSKNSYCLPMDCDTDYTTRSISFSTMLFFKVPEQVNDDTQHHMGHAHFSWGVNTAPDHLSLRPKQDKFIVPKVGRFVVFPSWLKHSVLPFEGDGVMRVLLANFNMGFSV